MSAALGILSAYACSYLRELGPIIKHQPPQLDSHDPLDISKSNWILLIPKKNQI